MIHGDRRIPAKLLSADARSGIALVKVDYNSPFIPVGNSKGLSLASPVLAIGFPVDLAATPSFGIVAGFDRQFLGRYFMTTHIRALSPSNPGLGGTLDESERRGRRNHHLGNRRRRRLLRSANRGGREASDGLHPVWRTKIRVGRRRRRG